MISNYSEINYKPFIFNEPAQNSKYECTVLNTFCKIQVSGSLHKKYTCNEKDIKLYYVKSGYINSKTILDIHKN